MDDLSPSSSDFLPNIPSPGSRSGGQRVYTTVGSVYNGNVTPLQPPTRRGRMNRQGFMHNSPTPDGSLGFSPAVLSSLRELSGSPESIGRRAHHYSPLQQNYDRAATPALDKSQPQIPGLVMSVPGMRSGNMPTPASVTLGGLKQAQIGFVGSNGADMEMVSSEDALAARFNVKGLTNLASYPNPMQQTARKALAKARTANVGINRVDALPSISHASSDLTRERQVLGLLGNNTLANGPGAPLPLTAGPPGLRQYKPSTFEGAIKALGESFSPKTILGDKSCGPDISPERAGEYSIGDAGSSAGPVEALLTSPPQARAVPPSTPMNRGRNTREEMFEFVVDRRAPLPNAAHHAVKVGAQSTTGKVAQGGYVKPLETLTGDFRPRMLDTEGPEVIQKYYPHGFPLDYRGQSLWVLTDWMKAYPLTEGFAWSSALKSIAERRDELDRRFYSGTSLLAEKMQRAAEGSSYFGATCPMPAWDVGQPCRLGRNGKVVYERLTTEQAKTMDRASHSEPLLNMAFTTLLGYAATHDSMQEKEKWCSGFKEPDTGLVDRSNNGNRTVFRSSNDGARYLGRRPGRF